MTFRRRTFIVHPLATNWPIGASTGYDVMAADPCPPPSALDLKTRFPAFKDVPDAVVTLAIGDASCWADTSWTNNCSDCTKAILFLAAHYLALELYEAAQMPIAVPTDEGGVTFIEGGQTTQIKFKEMSVGFAPNKSIAQSRGRGGSGAEGAFDLDTTPYGQMYLNLLMVNKPAIAVV